MSDDDTQQLRRIFLCHNSEDKPGVRAIRDQLKARGIETWMDEDDLQPGLDWSLEIEKQIRAGIAAAVFVGASGFGRWQDEEYRAFLRANKERKLPIIPVILSTCEKEPDLPPFLQGRTWVDLRTDDGFERLIWGITGIKPEEEERPTVLIAPCCSDRILRQRRADLVTYCQNADLRVLGNRLYSSGVDDLEREFEADLKESDVFVQLLIEAVDSSQEFPDGRDVWFYALAEQHLPKNRLLRWRMDDTNIDAAENDAHRELISDPDVLEDLPAKLDKLVIERATRAFEVGDIPAIDQDALAMVKYNEKDTDQTRSMIDRLHAAHIKCLQSKNGSPFMDRLDEHIPFDALVVVLGNCPDAWLEDRGEELMTVELNLKEQSPLQVYYHASESNLIPPFVGENVLEIKGVHELGRLVEAIEARKTSGADHEY